MDRLRRFLWTPLGWLLFSVIEVLVASWVLKLVLPRLPPVPAWAVLIVGLGGLFILNMWIRRRFLVPGSPEDPAAPSGRG